ncbi:uncharacterized protein B0I36DRAFT_414872 [Microdochium trichocladiopsis]|uniref:Non-reducing end beta-L-arabinofuranosidase n=1 Tax=Microdochium trichocladiopsis TaxID=1682393 RepID=A0A9P8Y1P1_9PEZI|nr:uncharacterized protein B0I36DRAFT_414872 [Microdochium trichocladiopsis]KAH7026431.1 hypothetical protein B0I36DRAFT_414872 [Microdochium trichocladiopsis]
MAQHPQTIFHETTLPSPSLLQSRREIFHAVGVKAQLAQLRKTGRYTCFDLKWQPGVYDDLSRWPCPPPVYWDSDVAKWIEGACYLLLDRYDAEVDAAVRAIVDMMRSAQGDDGYLNLYFTVIEPEKRWSNLRDQHELYNAGHLVEAALAHSKYYKNDLLLEPIIRYVKLIRSVFGPEEGRRHGYPGHPETELALLRLHAVTGNQDAYELGRYFIEERGNPTGQHGQHYYDWEAEERGDSPWKRPNSYVHAYDHFYNQSHKPILEQDTVEGHAVRAILWDNMVDRKMYLTGGIGAMLNWEGFGIDYFLPQGTDDGGCYNETCASIGVMMLAERLLHLDLDSRYADVMELCLYNTVMGAMGLDGRSFTYVNQLASSEKDNDRRESWFETSCCPPNLMRLFGSIGGYLWDYGSPAADEVFVNVHLYTTAEVSFETGGGAKVSFAQLSDWPQDGKVSFQIKAPSTLKTTIRLRWPSWSPDYKITPSTAEEFECVGGYIVIPSSYTSKHSEFTVDFDGFAPRQVYPHPYTNQHVVALARGPVVYCVEDTDNPWEKDHFRDTGLARHGEIQERSRSMPMPLGSGDQAEKQCHYIELQAKGWTRKHEKGSDTRGRGRGQKSIRQAYAAEKEADNEEAVTLVFLPYYLRANRGGRGMMRVGLLRE